MTYEPIQQLEVENYGCIRKASFILSPLHALIGPNDSGKSTILRALRVATQFATDAFPASGTPFDPMLDLKSVAASLLLRYEGRLGYHVWTAAGQQIRESVLLPEGERPAGGESRALNVPGILQRKNDNPAPPSLVERLTTAVMVRFDPNALRTPSKQILASEPVRFLDETGKGLASVYQAINSRDVDAFVAIRDRTKQLFPTIQTIRVPTVKDNLVTLEATLNDGTVVPAAALSEGLLYFLGFAALRYLAETRLYLIEEPENGLHPARISEVMAILREISKQSQVVVATHSPLVVNELQGHEVSVVTRDPEQGTRATLLKDVPRFEEASKVYQPGELWLSYADGKMEEPLLKGKPRA
ncbi:MAG: ATP-binding protein [Polyangiaceae bacterium]|nr:ATP-binding protein [Polyangiaceae bacterium]